MQSEFKNRHSWSILMSKRTITFYEAWALENVHYHKKITWTSLNEIHEKNILHELVVSTEYANIFWDSGFRYNGKVGQETVGTTIMNKFYLLSSHSQKNNGSY